MNFGPQKEQRENEPECNVLYTAASGPVWRRDVDSD